MSTQQKVAIVTGAASGIGKSVAECYSQEGMAVVLADVDQNLAERTAEGIRRAGGKATPLRADVSNPADCERMVQTALKQYGRLDVACNNTFLGDHSGITAAVASGASLWTDMRETVTFSGRTGSGEDAFFASNP